MKKMFSLLLITVIIITALPTLADDFLTTNAKLGIDISAMPEDAQKVWMDMFKEDRYSILLLSKNAEESYSPTKKNSHIRIGHHTTEYIFCVSGIGSLEFWELGEDDTNKGKRLYSFDLSLVRDERGEYTLDIWYFPIFTDGYYQLNYLSAPQIVNLEACAKLQFAREYLRIASELWTITKNNIGAVPRAVNVHFLSRDKIWYHGIVTSENYQLIMRPIK